MRQNQNQKILRMVQLAMLIALVVVLQLFGGSIPLGMIPLTFALVPIVVGAILLGPVGGSVLGFAFGLVTVIMTPANVILNTLFQANPICYILIAMSKAILAGLGAAWIYRGLDKCFKSRYRYLSTVIASVSVPIINTGIFALGMMLFFSKEAAMFPQSFPAFFGGMNGAIYVIFIGLIGFNFIGEFIVNLVLSPAIVRIVQVVENKIKK